jgi:hypothetical protein
MGQDAEMLTELLKLLFSLVTGNLDMGEVFGKTATMELVFLILQLALGKYGKTERPGLKTLECLFYFRERCGRQVE